MLFGGTARETGGYDHGVADARRRTDNRIDDVSISRIREAYDFAPVYGWFTAGFGPKDLRETKALLDELAS
jgi:hypothetical protein